MFDYCVGDAALAAAPADQLAPLRQFLGESRDGLLDAAVLLAGPLGARLVHGIADDLAAQVRLSRRTERVLFALLDLLELRHVYDPERDESSHFAALSPCDPRVEDLCALTDDYRDALEAAGLDHPSASRRIAA